jgi:3-oxoacyl-[acyl-carrier-protein] synthase II
LKSVAITGLGVVSAIGGSSAETRQALLSGRSGIGPVTIFDPSPYPGRIAAEIPDWETPEELSRGSSLLLAAMEEALAGTGEDLRADLILGTTLGGMERGTAYMERILGGDAPRDAGRLLSDFLPACQLKLAQARFGIQGTCDIVSNACSSGTDAVGLGFERIRAGAAAAAVAGGYDPLCEFVFAGFSSLMVTARGACRPFDRDREGMVLGEGAAVLLLEEEKAAHRRGAKILGLVRGYGAAADAHHLTQPDPAGSGLGRAAAAALESAGVQPGDVGYINLHGTATPYNDIAEYNGLLGVFGTGLASIPASSTKAMTGHTLGAAGAVEAVFCLLAMQEGILPPNLNLENRDSAMEHLRLVTRPGERSGARLSLSNSQGFGGGCGCVLLEKGDPVS